MTYIRQFSTLLALHYRALIDNFISYDLMAEPWPNAISGFSEWCERVFVLVMAIRVRSSQGANISEYLFERLGYAYDSD